MGRTCCFWTSRSRASIRPVWPPSSSGCTRSPGRAARSSSPRTCSRPWSASARRWPSSIAQKAIPLPPGTYRLVVVCKDVVGGNVNNYEQAVTVPKLDADRLSSSTLVLADKIEKVPMRSIGTGQFVIGSSLVRPRIGDVFTREETLGIYMKLYNFGADETTHRPDGEVQFHIDTESL